MSDIWTPIDVEIEERLEQFDPVLEQNWLDGERKAFARGPHLVCERRAETQPERFFAETLHVGTLERDNFQCWSGFYALFGPPKNPERGPNASAIRQALRACNLPDPHHVMERVRPSFKPRLPDVVGYNRSDGKCHWKFHEIKRTDPIIRGQLETLAVLRHVFGAEVAVVRYVSNDARVKIVYPRTLRAEFLEFRGSPADLPRISS
jgi:hypothetical protein